MSPEPSGLQGAIAAAFDANSFRLPATAIDSPPVSALLAALGTPDSLALDGAAPDASGLVVSGTLAGALPPRAEFLAGAKAIATFSLSGQTAQLRLDLVPAAGQPLPPAAMTSPMTALFEWSDMTFRFDSAAPAQLPEDFPAAYQLAPNSPKHVAEMARGMSIGAQVTSTELEWLIGKGPVEAAGPVEWSPWGPRFDLAVELPAAAAIPYPVELHLVGTLPEALIQSQPPGTSIAVPTLAIASNLKTKLGGRTVEIPLAGLAGGEGFGHLTVVAQLGQASAAALSELATMLGVGEGDLSGQAGDHFPALDGLSLKEVAFELGAVAGEMTLFSAAATVALRPPKPWQPLGSDLLVFEELDVCFTKPAQGGLETFATAQAELAGGELDATLSLPELAFTCDLAEGSPPIDLAKILSSMVGGSLGGGSLTCTQLRVTGNVSESSYRLIATVKEEWSVEVAGHTFELSSFGFDLARQAGATVGIVTGQFEVGAVPVLLRGEYSSAQAGWTLGGGIDGSVDVDFGTLIDDLGKDFGLPLELPSLQLEILDMQALVDLPGKSWGFSCDCKATILDQPVELDVDIGKTPEGTMFVGRLTIGSAGFEVDLAETGTDRTLAFRWSEADGEAVKLSEVAEHFDLPLPDLPAEFDLGLKEATLAYDTASASLAVSAVAQDGEVRLFRFPPKSSPGEKATLFALDAKLEVDLTALPVVGDLIPAGYGVKTVSLLYASLALSSEDVAAVGGMIPGDAAFPLPSGALVAGVSLALTLQTQGPARTLTLPLEASAAPAAATAPAAALPAAPLPAAVPAAPAGSEQAGAKWLPVDATLGPIHLQRLGAQYKSGSLTVMVDATLTAGPVEVGLEGLGASSPLKPVEVKPHLDGLSIAFSSPPVTLSGGLLSAPVSGDVEFEYLGEATLSLEAWQVTGVGSYARVQGQSSLFAFIDASAELGGPPAFFVTGLMAGFGSNSLLAMPAPGEVAKFPLLSGLDDPSVFGKDPSPSGVLDVLTGRSGSTAWVTPEPGQTWIAGGVRFRSFEIIIGHALFIAGFGSSESFTLLGLAAISLPQESENPYAQIALQLSASLRPEEGSLEVIASLTPDSYLLDPACVLTGGFAFCLWFGSNEHAGDCVLSVGGYHPSFEVPSWYPTPARVGFDWHPDGDVTISGGAYLAVTPGAAMAGCSLSVVFQSGDLRAWLSAWANVMVRWKPFWVEAEIGISVGASYRLDLLFTTVTLSVELGATLEIYGPPTGGSLHVDWSIISFTIGFGADRAEGPGGTIGWDKMKGLLPQDPSGGAQPILGVQVTRGLMGEAHDGSWLVRADELVLVTRTAIPAAAIPLLDGTPEPGGKIAIRPMGLEAESTHTVSVTEPENEPATLSAWSPAAVESNLPSALWGELLDGGEPPAGAKLVPARTGVELTAPRAKAGPSLGPIDMSLLVDPLAGGPMPLAAAAQGATIPAPVAAAKSLGKVEAAYGPDLEATKGAQEALLKALAALGAAPPTSAVPAGLATAAETSFAQAPMLAGSGAG